MTNTFDYYIEGKRIYIPAHFTTDELHCPCGCGMRVVPKLVVTLEALRELCGFPLKINSGARCEVHNKKIGGRPKSKHLKGIAADIAIKDAKQGRVIIHHAEKLGFMGIGTANTFIHVDLRNYIATWTY